MWLRHHSFRKAHISTGISVALMVVGLTAFGWSPSDAQYQAVIWTSAAIGFVVLMLQHELPHRRERRGRGGVDPRHDEPPR
ncbi:MAG: hypothetical protein GXY03_12365 [Solirubrobacterales bacterium]|nr:hypothetical protein [Solirubrobacterales bacterium]